MCVYTFHYVLCSSSSQRYYYDDYFFHAECFIWGRMTKVVSNTVNSPRTKIYVGLQHCKKLAVCVLKCCT